MMAKSEMWVRSDQKDIDHLTQGLGPLSHSQKTSGLSSLQLLIHLISILV